MDYSITVSVDNKKIEQLVSAVTSALKLFGNLIPVRIRVEPNSKQAKR